MNAVLKYIDNKSSKRLFLYFPMNGMSIQRLMLSITKMSRKWHLSTPQVGVYYLPGFSEKNTSKPLVSGIRE
ncbi:MAG: hypothetical protein JKY19_11280 [Alcanivoracaceae bacterium]|nr:hypothetical protein [Alcanivoracaceae bacterium]